MSSLLDVKEISVSYGKVAAVRSVSLSVDKGQIVTIIGPNGAGKTTLLAALMGLLPSTGTVVYDGCNLAESDVEDRVNMGLCLVPEQRELFSDMSVEDNLLLGAYIHRHDRSWVQQGFEIVYDRFPRLSERRSQLARTLSGGERQMLALGRALMSKPRLLMLDEPATGLDPAGMRDMRLLVTRLASEGITVLLSSHLLAEVEEVCDRVAIVRKGSIAYEGRLDDLRREAGLSYTLSTTDDALAARVIDEFEAVSPDPQSDGSLRFHPLDEAAVAELSRRLVEAGALIREIAPRSATLEELFFDLTEGSH